MFPCQCKFGMAEYMVSFHDHLNFMYSSYSLDDLIICWEQIVTLNSQSEDTFLGVSREWNDCFPM